MVGRWCGAPSNGQDNCGVRSLRCGCPAFTQRASHRTAPHHTARHNNILLPELTRVATKQCEETKEPLDLAMRALELSRTVAEYRGRLDHRCFPSLGHNDALSGSLGDGFLWPMTLAVVTLSCNHRTGNTQSMTGRRLALSWVMSHSRSLSSIDASSHPRNSITAALAHAIFGTR